MKLKVGDRVRAVNVGDRNDLQGEAGTVLFIAENTLAPYLVEFDEVIECGHKGLLGYAKGKEGHCWWCLEKEIKPLDENPMDEWDGSFQNVVAEYNRMCDSYPNCERCPLHTGSRFCLNFVVHNPFLAEEKIRKWSEAHPKEPTKHVKTRAEDFLERNPKARKHDDGSPRACAYECGYFEYCPPDKSCVDCWNTPLEESEGEK